MKQRVITAAVALLLFVPFVYMGGMPLQAVAALLTGIGVYELFKMRQLALLSPVGVCSLAAAILLVLPKDNWFPFLPAAVDNTILFYLPVLCLLTIPVFSKNTFNFDDMAFPVLTALYVGMGFQNFVLAREDGLTTLIYALFVVWSTDIGAYFFGMKFGKNKLAPAISPNKSIEGSVGGIISAVVVAFIFLLVYPGLYSLPVMLVLTVVFSIVGQLGDLVQSAYKRHYGVKDSGNILPGHGGILDRFDSLLFVFPVMHLMGLF